MFRASSLIFRRIALLAAFGASIWVMWAGGALAQEPPLDSPRGGGLLVKTPEAIAMDGWLFFPAIRVYSLYTDNLFQSAIKPLSVLGFGVTPGLNAQWSNGIHSTAIIAGFDRQVFPTDNQVNTFDPHATFTQRYEALRDLSFRLTGDYLRRTYSSALQNAIPTAGGPGGTVLPNGDTLLPNGTIISPTGQVVSQATPTIAANNNTTAVNPFDQFTGTFFVDKIFNRGILTVSGALTKTDYETQSLQDTHNRTLRENGGVWLGPLFYAYSDGSYATTVAEATSIATTSYRIIGGIGTRQLGLLRASGYLGHQASRAQQGSSGGDVYGGALTYYPTPVWTLSLNLDETINIASQPFASQFALTLPQTTPVQIPIGLSTRTTSTSFHSDYRIAPLWVSTLQLNYSRIEYVESPRRDNTWLFDALLEYDIWHNMSITWEYRYSRISSNAPFTTSTSNLTSMGAAYKF
jgi:hypothetical protein